MLTQSQTDFLNEFDAVAAAFASGLECCVYTYLGRDGAELDVHVLNKQGAVETTVATAKGKTKAAALTAITQALSAVFGAATATAPTLSTEKGSATEAQRRNLLNTVNRGCFDRGTKSRVMLNIYSWSEAKAAAELQKLEAAVQVAESGKWDMLGSAEVIKPAA